MSFKHFGMSAILLIWIISGCSDTGEKITDYGDGDGTPSLSIADQQVTEGDTVKLTVTLSPPATEDVVFSYATSDGTAHHPEDYLDTSGTDTILAGLTSATLTVITMEVAPEEECETFLVTLSSVQNAAFADSVAEVTIYDDDPTPVSFAGDVRPILLSAGCTNAGCHGGGSSSGGLSLGNANYNSVRHGRGKNGAIVIPCEPAASNLYLKTTSSPPFGSQMPLGLSPLSTTQQETIRTWIRQGAQDN